MIDLLEALAFDRKARAGLTYRNPHAGLICHDAESGRRPTGQHSLLLEAGVRHRPGSPPAEIVSPVNRDAILHMIATNLITNTVSHAGMDARNALTWRCEDDEAVFDVADHCRGMAAEYLPRLTERWHGARSRHRQACPGMPRRHAPD